MHLKDLEKQEQIKFELAEGKKKFKPRNKQKLTPEIRDLYKRCFFCKSINKTAILLPQLTRKKEKDLN